MVYTLEIYGCLCEPKEFTINGIPADRADFGDKYDNDSENAEDYCCGNMTFFPNVLPSEGVLDKYSITLEEHNTIAQDLASKLSWGACGWCS